MSTPTEDLEIVPASPEEFQRALETLLADSCGASGAHERTGEPPVRHGDGDGELPSARWVALRGGQAVGAVAAQVQPGATALVFPPWLAAEESESTATQLLAALCAELERRGLCLAQALVERETRRETTPLLAAGFQRVTELMYLVSLESEFPRTPSAGDLEFQPYSPEQHARLADLIERTYEGTLDCPELNGVRSTDDVLAGYKATGIFDPAQWLFVRHQGRDIGCLLLTSYAGTHQWELVYMGLVPEYRGRGLGLPMVRQAQFLAGQAGAQRLVLAVDAHNAPAVAAYAAAGFLLWDQRGVYLKIFAREQPGESCQAPRGRDSATT